MRRIRENERTHACMFRENICTRTHKIKKTIFALQHYRSELFTRKQIMALAFHAEAPDKKLYKYFLFHCNLWDK